MEEYAKYPENTWMCKFCREFNFNEEWVKLETATCQHCNKFSEEREREIKIALNKQYKERECEKCQEKKFLKADNSACDECLKLDDGEVLPNADEESGEKRIVYQSDTNYRDKKKLCSICFTNLKGHEKDGFCFQCQKKKDDKENE